MNREERSHVSERLQVLVGTRVTKVNRSYGDIWIDFTDEHGRCYIILMQTLFRLCDEKKILITDTDKYKGYQSEDNDSFEWNVRGANIFDRWVATNKNELFKSLIVQEVKVTELGDLVILFDKNITLTVFLEVTNDVECWRFFEKGKEEKDDLIVLGNGIIAGTIDQ